MHTPATGATAELLNLSSFGHSCVRIERGDHALVIDPGIFSDIEAAVVGVDAILITHAHSDHIDVQAVQNVLIADSRLRLFGPSSVAEQLTGVDDQVVTVDAGQAFDAAGLTVRAIGGQHAVIHPLIPVIQNVGYLVEDQVYHPGDSLIVPPHPVQTLLLPASAPWSKTSEVIDFAIAVHAPTAHPIHDGLSSPTYKAVVRGNFEPILTQYNVHLADWPHAPNT